jgi:sigma-E factor negative regulatory protein RseC
MIDHDGIIEQIHGDIAHVKISSESACAACHAKGVCMASDKEDKYLDVPMQGVSYSSGETVKVLVEKRLGFKAVFLGYFLPFLVVMGVLVGCLSAGVPELQAGLWALLSLPPYSLALYLARNRIASTFSFSMQKTAGMV